MNNPLLRTYFAFVLLTAATAGVCPLLASGGAPPRGIQGQVLDPASRPVPHAVVDCGSGRSSLTDSEGRFHFESGAPCDATITAASGFAPAHVHLESGDSSPVRIVLDLAARSDRVVVTATRTPATLEESGVSASVFTAADLAGRQYPPVPDLLREVPGMAIVDSGRRGAVTSIFTRGGQSTSTLFLLDGVPLNSPGGQIDLSALTTAGLDRVEVVRGAESALFGSDAASGVVQLFSTRGQAETRIPHVQLNWERGNFQTDHWVANLNGGLADRLDYSLTADQLHTGGMFANDFFRNTAGTGNIGFRLSKSLALRAVYREYDSVSGNPGQVGYNATNLDAWGGNRQSTLSVRLDDARSSHFVERFSFGYDRLRNIFADDGTTPPIAVAALVRNESLPTPRVYLVRQVPADFPASSVPAGLSLASTTVYDFPGTFISVDDRASADYQGTWTHRGGALVFGYRFERQAGDISGAAVARYDNGGFFHEQATIGRRLFLTGGARVENSSTFGSRFVPRGSASFQLFGTHGAASSTLVRVSGGRGYTEPSLLENFARESYYVGNPALRPERTAMFDAGLVQELFSRRVRLEATWFRNAFSDLIVFDSTNFPSTWSNIDRSWARGFETSASVHLTRYVQVFTSYTRTNTRIVTTNAWSAYSGVGQELPRRPRDAGAAWLTAGARRWSAIVGGRAVGERQDSDYTFGVTRNPGYGTLFVSGSYQLTRHVTPYLRMDNLLNEKYEEVLGYTALSRSAVGGVRFAW